MSAWDDAASAIGALPQQGAEVAEHAVIGGKAASQLVDEIIHQHNSEKELSRRVAQLEAMHAIARGILAIDGPEAGFRTALQQLTTLVPCCACGVLLFGPDCKSLMLVTTDKSSDAVLPSGAIIPLTDSASTAGFLRALREEGVHLVDEIQGATAQSTWLAALARKGIRAVLSAPLVAQCELLGVLSLGSQEPASYSAEDAKIVQEVADMLAIAAHQAQLFQDLMVNRAQFRRLTQQVVNAREEERQRIARILHDEAGQTLAVLNISLALIERDLSTDSPEIVQRVARAGAMVDEMAAHIRALAHSLRPPALDHLGINAALEAYCQELVAETQLEIEYQGMDLSALSPAARICLYRCHQEALTNILKHASASRVQVELSCLPVSAQVRLAVKDNGRGFNAEQFLSGRTWAEGSGLFGMREWLDSLDGELRVTSQPGKGCLLEAVLPLASGEST